MLYYLGIILTNIFFGVPTNGDYVTFEQSVTNMGRLYGGFLIIMSMISGYG